MRTKHISTIFAILLLANFAYLLFWGLGYTNYNSPVFFTLAVIFGMFMAFNIGGNDVANSFGTSVGAKTLTVKQALCIAAIFEISGAVIAGGEVTSTIKSGIVDINAFGDLLKPEDFMHIMLSALIAAAFWLLFATRMGLPVSTTHSIIGAIVGASMALASITQGVDAAGIVRWNKIGEIAASWLLSPLLGGLAAYLLYSFITRYILNFNERAHAHLKLLRSEKIRIHKRKSAILLSEIQQSAYLDYDTHKQQIKQLKEKERHDRKLERLSSRENNFNPHSALQFWTPLLASIAAMIMSSVIIFKALNKVVKLSVLTNSILIVLIGIFAWFAIRWGVNKLRDRSLNRSTFILFSWLQVATACGFAFSHGSNDIANAIGPFAAILDVLRSGEIHSNAAIPFVAMLAFGVSLVVGLWFIGKRVIATVGSNLTKMHPASGFTAELAAATVVMIASVMGLPVSSTHILVGAVLGVGLVNRNANWRLMRPIGLAWVVTVPVAGIVSAIAFFIIRLIF